MRERRKMKRVVGRIYRIVMIAVIICCLVFATLRITGILVPAVGIGPSMEPTIESGECYWIIKTGTYQRGDIVSVKLKDGTRITKRIIACPGDELLIGYSTVWISGDWLNEPYLDYRNKGWNDFGKYDEKISLGENEYFVMGDNRKQSLDSRHFGTIKGEQITGKVVGK